MGNVVVHVMIFPVYRLLGRASKHQSLFILGRVAIFWAPAAMSAVHQFRVVAGPNLDPCKQNKNMKQEDFIKAHLKASMSSKA